MHTRQIPEPDFKTLFQAAPGCYLVLLPDFTIVAVSDAYLRATMTRREDIVGCGLFDVFPDNPDDPTADGVSNLRISLNNALRTKLPDTMAVQKYDIRRPASEGGEFEERYWSPINTPVLDTNRKIAYIIHRVEDVTDFVRLTQQRAQQNEATAELKARAGDMEEEILKHAQELLRLNKELRDNQIFLDSVIHNMPMMVFVKDAKELRFVLLNKAGEKLLGYTNTDLAGKNDYDFFPKNQADFFVEKDRTVLKEGVLVDISEPIQTLHLGTRILHTKKIPIRDSNGKPVYLLGISEDITDAKMAEAQIGMLNKQLERNVENLKSLNQELESFSYSVSHDLRTPLRGMSGFARILMEEYEDLQQEERKMYLERICAAADRMGMLIDGLLNLSRLTRKEIYRETVDLSTIARKIIDDLKAADSNRQIAVVIQEKIEAEGDRSLLEVALQNLLHNAWKFSSNNPNAQIEVGSERNNGKGPIYFVKDNGAGFDMAYKDKLFGAFQRLHSQDEFEGYGIGLATVQRAIRRHGGRIWAESEVNKGATFYFTLPVSSDAL